MSPTAVQPLSRAAGGVPSLLLDSQQAVLSDQTTSLKMLNSMATIGPGLSPGVFAAVGACMHGSGNLELVMAIIMLLAWNGGGGGRKYEDS